MPSTVLTQNAPPAAITAPQVKTTPSSTMGSFSYRSSQYMNQAYASMGTKPKNTDRRNPAAATNASC